MCAPLLRKETLIALILSDRKEKTRGIYSRRNFGVVRPREIITLIFCEVGGSLIDQEDSSLQDLSPGGRLMKLALPLVWLSLSVAAGMTHAEMHKCTMADGKIEYTDQPAPQGRNQPSTSAHNQASPIRTSGADERKH
jgi:Domain of unknown function (DUF4124)